MKKICASIMTTVVGLTVGCVLNGCAHDKKEAVYQPIEPAHWPPGTQTVDASTNSPLAYQWYFTNGSPTTTTFSVTAAGGTNGALYYPWFKNTNSPQSVSINVVAMC